MTVSADDVRRRLPRADLIEVPLPDGAGTTWVVGLSPGDDLVAAWSVTKEAVADLGLRPVAVTTWGSNDWQEADLFSRFFYGQDADPAPQRVLDRADALTADAAIDRFGPGPWADPWGEWDEIVAAHLDRTEQLIGIRPDDDAWADLRPGDEIGLERRLLHWEEERRRTEPPEPSSTFGWFDPSPEPRGLALVPVPRPADTLAYLSFFGADGNGGHEALVRIVRDWEDRFGAELVASWGTMLQLVVTRPPTQLDDAFDLAVEIVTVAPCTTVLPGEGLRHLARHLWQGERWFLHERP